MRDRSGTAVAVSLCALGWLLAVAGLEGSGAQEGAAPTLPTPTGPYAVGRILEDWTDAARADPLAPDPSIRRELPVVIWYPAEAGGSPASYFPEPLREAFAERAPPAGPGAVYAEAIAALRSHAIDGAPVAGAETRFPIVLLKPGLGFQALQYTVMAEELASHGYVVVGSDAPYTSPFVVYADGREALRTDVGGGRAAPDDPPHELAPGAPNGRQLPVLDVWVADNAFIADRLAALDAADPTGRFLGRLDLAAIGAIGHSFGGAAALELCHDDARCRAAVDIDGAPLGEVTRDGMAKPALMIWSDRPIWTRPEAELGEPERALLAALDRIEAAVPNAPSAVILTGAAHYNFSDAALHSDLAISRQAGALGPIDPELALTITNEIVREFFDEHLRGSAEGSIDRLAAEHAEISIMAE